MAALEHEIDANFYNLIHQLVGSQKPEDRRHHRQSFQLVQQVAPRRGPGIPRQSDFFEVTCHDLTQRGFSFLTPHRPAFASLVVAFGIPPQIIYLGAQVVHCDEVLLDPSGRVHRVTDSHGPAPDVGSRPRVTKPMVLVGCRFTERLNHV